jgi:hypothetical protein
MNKSRFFFAMLFVAGSLFLGGCKPGSDKPSEAQITQTAVVGIITSQHQPSLKLYTSFEEQLLATGAGSGTNQYYPRYGYNTAEWIFTLDNQVLKDQITYHLVMASPGDSAVTVEVVLKQGDQESVLGTAELEVNSDRYQPYTGELSGPKIETKPGDQLILRLTASGDDFGVAHGMGNGSSLNALEFSVTGETASEREKALVWFATNHDGGIDAVFADFQDVLDTAIATGEDIEWHYGKSLMIAGKPFILRWVGNVFTTEEMTPEKAAELSLGDETVTIDVLNEPAITEITQPAPTSPAAAPGSQATVVPASTSLQEASPTPFAVTLLSPVTLIASTPIQIATIAIETPVNVEPVIVPTDAPG